MSSGMGAWAPFSEALYELARKYQREARNLFDDYESELPREVARFLDDVAVIIPDAQREAHNGAEASR